MHTQWQIVASNPSHSNPLFTVLEETYRSPLTEQLVPFYILDGADWINVIPVTDDGSIVFVKQYRHGSREETIEVPGGAVDSGESPLEAAHRELLEETGYRAETMEEIGYVSPNPALFRNYCYTFLATDLIHTGPPKQTATEQTSVEFIQEHHIVPMISQKKITHALTIAAFYWYAIHRGLFP